MGRFVEIAVDADGVAPDAARALVRACPVDIFRLGAGGRLETHPERVDECILCGQCVALAPKAVAVARAYGARRAVLASGGDDG